MTSFVCLGPARKPKLSAALRFANVDLAVIHQMPALVVPSANLSDPREHLLSRATLATTLMVAHNL